MALISVKCPKCGKELHVNEDAETVFCNYCGERIVINDANAQSVGISAQQPARSDDYPQNTIKKEVSMNTPKNKKRDEYYFRPKSSKLESFLIFLDVIGLIAAYIVFHRFGAVCVAALQIVLLVISKMIKAGQIPSLRKISAVSILFTIASVLLVIPYFNLIAGSGPKIIREYEELNWPESGLSEKLPKPTATHGKILWNHPDELHFELYKMEESDFLDYAESLKKNGYVVDPDQGASSYEAYNEEGYKVSVSYFSSINDGELSVYAYAPTQMSEFEWPVSELSSLLPSPSSNMGNVDVDRSDCFVIYVSNTSPDEYSNYVEQVLNSGFSVDYSRKEEYFKADDSNGNHVTISYEGFNTMKIRIEKPEEPKATEETNEITPTPEQTPTPDASSNDPSSFIEGVMGTSSDILGKVSEGLSNFTGDNGYSSYSEIYEDYKKKLQDATPTLIEEYKAEVANNTKGLEGRAEIANAKVQKLAEIETEGTQKMAEFMYSKGSGKYEEYSEWAGKLYEIYNEEGTEIYNVYLYGN